MKKPRPSGPRSTIYRLTLGAFILVLIVLGLLCANLAKSLESSGDSWGTAITLLNTLSDVLIVSGAIGIALELFTGRAKEEADTERLRALLKESAPEFRDAVVQGFAVQSDDLARVASPELLDGIAKNVLALRLGDRQFAEEIYEDVRDQAIRAPERWYDVDVSVRVSPAGERNASGVPLFEVLIDWEYTVTPSHPLRRFACTSDPDLFHEYVTDVPATLPWLMTPRPGMDARKKDSFELLAFSVDGEQRPIRRTERKDGQVYTVDLGTEVLHQAEPVRIKHLYRTVTAQSTHRLFIEIAQPARNVSLELDYSDTNISRMTVTDLVTSKQRPRISQLPAQVKDRALSVDVPGWLLPKAGFTFVWTIDSEETAAPDESAPSAAA